MRVTFDKAALDRHITGNWGEDQLDVSTARSCGEEMRTGACVLDPGHPGRHTTVGFYCDLCGKMRRGQPHVITQLMADGYREPVAECCWLCREGIT
jgi:hypothetical protein